MKIRPIFILSLLTSLLLLCVVYILKLNLPLGDKIQIIMVIVTFMAVVVALFQEKIKRYFDRVKLKLQIILEPPDCHQIDLSDQITGRFISKCIYLRIRVTNIDDKTARDVEILASNLWRITDGKQFKVFTFLPMNLRWSHSHPIKVTIPPQSFRFCDLGPVRPLEDKVILKFDMETQPNPVSGGVYPNVIFSDVYILEVLLSGDNTYPLLTKWKIEVPNEWADNESEMLSKIKVEQIN